MDLEDISLRYQEIARWKRLLVLSALAVLPGVYDFWNRWDGIIAAKTAVLEEKNAKQEVLRIALDKHKKLSKLQENLSTTEAQVKEASKKLPDEIFIDKILQRTELLAQELGIGLKLFQPMDEIPSETAFKYLKLPVHLNLVGTYGQIASFFDHVVHLEFIANIENIKLDVEQDSIKNSGDMKIIDDEKMEKMKRSKIRIRASCDMMIFRSLTDREAEALQSIIDNKRKAEKISEAQTVKAEAQSAKADMPSEAKKIE